MVRDVGENQSVPFDEKCFYKEVGPISSQELKVLPNVLPIEASHSSLDIFERLTLLVIFDSSFEQKIGPLYALNGPTLKIEDTGDKTNFIDLQNIYLEVKCKIS